MRRPLSYFQFLPWLMTATLLACEPAEPESDPTHTDTAERQSAEVITGEVAARCSAADTIDYNKELVITGTRVGGDSCRTRGIGCAAGDELTAKNRWNFIHLMRQAAGGDSISDKELSKFILTWLNSFLDDSLVNGRRLEKRTGIWDKVIKPWQAASAGCGTTAVDLGCTLNFNNVPLRLRGIVNRLDLRGNEKNIYGGGLAGEGRFVFGFVDGAGMELEASVILEYELPASSREDLKRWALDWHALGAAGLSLSDYRRQLQKITDRFTSSGVLRNPFSRNNGTALRRVRSNELAFAPPPPPAALAKQEFREFALCNDLDPACAAPSSGQLLRRVLTAQTPDSSYQNDAPAELDAWVAAQSEQIRAESHSVPVKFLAGAAAIVPGSSSFVWNPIRDSDVRRLFALSTCTGCHFRETLMGISSAQTGFHIHPVNAERSPFLSGEINVSLPLSVRVKYDEVLRRRCELSYLVESKVTPLQPLTKASGRPH